MGTCLGQLAALVVTTYRVRWPGCSRGSTGGASEFDRRPGPSDGPGARRPRHVATSLQFELALGHEPSLPVDRSDGLCGLCAVLVSNTSGNVRESTCEAAPAASEGEPETRAGSPVVLGI